MALFFLEVLIILPFQVFWLPWLNR